MTLELNWHFFSRARSVYCLTLVQQQQQQQQQHRRKREQVIAITVFDACIKKSEERRLGKQTKHGENIELLPFVSNKRWRGISWFVTRSNQRQCYQHTRQKYCHQREGNEALFFKYKWMTGERAVLIFRFINLFSWAIRSKSPVGRH